MIECRDITARAGDFTLRDVSFTIPDGAHAVLTGPTASGKSTLLDAIAGLVPVAHGRVLLGGRDVTHASPESRGVGVVPQHGYLFPHLDVRANVAYGASDDAIVTSLMQRFGIASLENRRVRALSGGERQLVALCRALATRPRVLLLDEPFSALDEDRRHAAAAELDAVHRDEGFTVLHATHHIAEAGARATMRLRMRDGRVIIGS
jgi:ABC-type sugar transport system ATPase subunit